MMQYSKELVSKYQEYMLWRYGVEISDDKAQLDLDSLSGLYLAFTKPSGESVLKLSLE